VYCVGNPIVLLDYDGRDIYPALLQNTDS